MNDTKLSVWVCEKTIAYKQQLWKVNSEGSWQILMCDSHGPSNPPVKLNWKWHYILRDKVPDEIKKLGVLNPKMDKPITPLLAVDALIIGDLKSVQGVVLIKRKNPPYGWALPGGFVDIGETVEQAVVREAKEETNLDFTIVELVGIYSKPDRDPRGHTVSIVYAGKAAGDMIAKDDATEISVFSIYELPELAFDHKDIIMNYFFGEH